MLKVLRFSSDISDHEREVVQLLSQSFALRMAESLTSMLRLTLLVIAMSCVSAKRLVHISLVESAMSVERDTGAFIYFQDVEGMNYTRKLL